MAESAVIFVLNRSNRNSAGALAGAVDVAAGLDDVDLVFLWDRNDLATKIARLTRYDRIMIAFSFATASVGHVRKRVLELRASLRQRPDTIFVAGGPHATGDPQGTLDLGFDIAVRGEAEESFAALLRRWSGGALWEGIPGLAYRRGSQLVLEPPARSVEIDDYPPFSIRYGLWGFMEISRGCPWACCYCQTSHAMGGRMRHRSVAHIVRAIEEAMDVGYTFARFVTPNAFAYESEDGRTANLPALEELLKAVSDMVGKDQTYLGSFPSEVRPEMVSLEAVELIKQYTANTTILLGAQSGSPRLLEAMHRGHTAEDVYRAVDIIVRGGLVPTVDFIFGLPGETAQDQTSSIEMIRRLAARGVIIHGHVFMPLPGSAWASEPPGVVTPEVESLLGELGRKGQHFGAWKREERLARASQ